MHKLWYEKEASRWTEALPLGNGRIGVMAYSGALSEKFMFNEDTLWTGYPNKDTCPEVSKYMPKLRELIKNRKYEKADKIVTGDMLGFETSKYIPFGMLDIVMKKCADYINPYFSITKVDPVSQIDISNYSRELDLKTATITSSFLMDGNKITRKSFVSFPDNVFVADIRSEYKQALHFDAFLGTSLDCTVKGENDTVTVEGICPVDYKDVMCLFEIPEFKKPETEGKDTIPFGAKLKVLTDGLVISRGSTISVHRATYATLILSIRTGFTKWNESPRANGRKYMEACEKDIENASKFTFDELYTRHLKDYCPKYDRCGVTTGEIDARPTNVLIEEATVDSIPEALPGLMFNFSRYLLLAGSREGTQPLNLQGIWGMELDPMWKCGYTTNINLQMNYWPAEMSALPECHEPLFSMLKDLSVAGKEIAQKYFGTRGWTTFHNSDVWRFCLPAGTLCKFAFWPMCGLWTCRHIWEHYDYNHDKKFLEEHFNVLEGALDFLEDWLYEDENGYLTTTASISPENTFVFNGKILGLAGISAMDIGIITDFTVNLSKICDILGEKDDVKSRCEYIKEHITPFKTTSDGRLQEWNEDFVEADPGHRHISHLYAVHPAQVIKKDSPLFSACKKSMDHRIKHGGASTGWSVAWTINQYARLLDGDAAYKFVKMMFAKSVYPNLFDAHPPFQIDGNFGFASGFGEMLLQSDEDTITLLPAIAVPMNKGTVRGLRARGGYECEFAWDGRTMLYYKVTKDGKEIASDKMCTYPVVINQ